MFKKIFAIPHFHFDVEWWKTDDGHAEDAIKIIDRAIELLDKYPNFTYVIDQVFAVRPFLERYPEKKEKLLKFIKDRRVEFVGATLAAPDENIPTGEALIRQFLYAKRFAENILKTKVIVGWMIDEFGHPHQMPQIAAKSGMKYFVFSRGIIPYDSMMPLNFWWTAPDGTKILAHWWAAHYAGLMPIFKSDKRNISRYYKEIRARVDYEGRRTKLSYLMFPFGTDFTIPDEAWIRFVDEWNKKEDIKIEFSLPSKYYEAIKDNEFETIKKEFNPVLTGCYESREKIKKYCRLSQNMILSSEKLNTIAYILGKEYPASDLYSAWENILENDFHDIICGTGTNKVYRKTLQRYETAINIIEQNKNSALDYILKKINTTSDGIPLVVFNPLCWKRSDIVKINNEFSEVEVLDNNNSVVPSQVNNGELYFIADVPSFGYKVYTIKKGKNNFLSDLKYSNLNIENEFYVIELDKNTGGIKRIYDKEFKVEFLKTDNFLGNEILIEEDVGNLWTIHKTGKIYKWNKYPAEIKLKENGPIRIVVEIKAKHHKAERTQRIIIYSNSRIIELETDINFFDKDKRIKVLFEPAIKGATIYETPFYCTEREDGHWPAQNFVDISDGKYGFAVINSGNPGYEVKNNVISLTLFRSVSLTSVALFKFIFKNLIDIIKTARKAIKLQVSGLNIFEFPLYKYHGLMLREWATDGGPDCFGSMGLYSHLVSKIKFWKKSASWEQGPHTFRYAIYIHKGSFREANLPRIGYEFNNPLIAKLTDVQAGNFPKDFSFCKINQDNIIISVLKKSEKDNSIILRMYETKGFVCEFEVEFFKEIKNVQKINLTEDEIYDNVQPCGNKFKDKIGAWEIASYKIEV